MELRSTSPVDLATAPLASRIEGTQLGQGDFLRLMTAQLAQQDPFNPVDNQQMVAQMAQFSSLAGVSETNDKLSAIGDQLQAQTELLTRLSELAANFAAGAAHSPTDQARG
ncbi:MAG: flagellar hook capping protein [Sphingopyxis sp.]|nr:flagellar hook capping protein [Sphingopyxis sp.]